MRAAKPFLWIIFLAFMFLLARNIVFKNSPRYYKRYFKKEYRNYSIKEGWEKANTTPFSTIRLFYNARRMNPEFRQNNLWGNLLGFVPLGIFLPLLIPFFRKGIYVFLAGFMISLGFEMAQLILGVGIFDVDDIILNTAGCLAGYILYWISVRIFGSPKRPVTAIK